MQNLLRTLTESRVKSSLPQEDLKLLLTTVKEGRSYDAKLSDPFYDSLEGLLLDLRTVTMDNRDAEAFLKPVSRSDVPDYYDVISSPMDMQTMLKRVKQKQYKSKREFKDDLDLIWSNCFLYNAAENHPLRPCAKRLQIKAAKLLQNITDRKERTDPLIPPDLAVTNAPARMKSNGLVNGYSNHRSPSTAVGTPAVRQSKKPRRDIPFADTPAITRTVSGMSIFSQLDQEMNNIAGPSNAAWVSQNTPTLAERLREFSQPADYESGSEDDASNTSDGTTGEKRKLNGLPHRPRKRTRIRKHAMNEDVDTVDLWWTAVQSDALLANGVPGLASVSSSRQHGSPSHIATPLNLSRKRPKAKTKRRKRKKIPDSPLPRSLLTLMNTNIRTMKRVRRTHAKFAALNVNVNNDDGDGSVITPDAAGAEEVDDAVDEHPWIPRGSGIDIGQENAADCLHWMGGKVLEHAGFQGTSKVALDVLASVTSEYLLNVGRTIQYLRDKYSRSMTAEEIILHTLFESGTAKIQDLERYIKDDVMRYGARLGDLEKKLVGAYREATVVEALDDDAIFGNEEEEEEGAFVMGDFADAFGEDFLGLRELGIAAEHGLSNLSVPKRLLKGKGKGENKLSSSEPNPAEPPPPFPPPPPFIPLTSDKLDNQIGLLKSYYQGRVSVIANPNFMQLSPGMPPPPYIDMKVYPPMHHAPPAPLANAAPITLPDDPPNLSQIKMGPLGQIVKGGPSGGAKKKPKRKEDPPMNNPMNPASQLQLSMSGSMPPSDSTPKKKKGPAPGGGSKKAKLAEALPPVVVASA